MVLSYELLPWDSNFFGFGVARLLTNQAGKSNLAETLALLKTQNVRLVYWATDPESRETQDAAKQVGGLLVDKKITYMMPLSPLSQTENDDEKNVEEYTEHSVTEELRVLAIAAGIFSRFRVDPNIPREKFEALYMQWITASVEKKMADVVLVMRDHESVEQPLLGFVTVGKKNDRGDIGLLAVAERARGRGVGTVLVHAAQQWQRAQGLAVGQVVTQGDNIAACKLYQRCGYAPERVDNIYHFWL